MLMSEIENLNVVSADPPARVIVNARTGTVVINNAVRVRPAAVSHGKLPVRIDEPPRVSQPPPFSKGQTAPQPHRRVAGHEETGRAACREKVFEDGEIQVVTAPI